tara:strand:- start:1493 stop:1900 length:408 start_codon:yes stop_codon:yes gene_type:complete
MIGFKLNHLQMILDNDFKDNTIEELELCRKDIKKIYDPNPYESLWFNNNRDDMIIDFISIDNLYNSLIKHKKMRTIKFIQQNDLKQCIRLNESYIYLFKLVYIYKKFTFCKVLSENFVDNTEIYNYDIVQNLFIY